MKFITKKLRVLLLSAVAVVVAMGSAVGQTDITEKFKDAEFRGLVYYLVGKTAPEPILDIDVSEITSLMADYESISDLSGIEYFTALDTLICDRSRLTTLDVSKNTKLTYLSCDGSQLTSLDVSKNTALTYLSCDVVPLTTLDVSNNTNLTFLSCFGTPLTSLDVTKNTALTGLHLGTNQTSLDVSKNTALTYLQCWCNLTKLDVSKNTALTELDCLGNQLTTLDVSKNTALTNLDCAVNQLTTLDVSGATALTELVCERNQLTTLDVSKNTALTKLNCIDNKLTKLDVSGAIALTELDCRFNQLTKLDVSKNTALTKLWCGKNELTAVDVSGAIALEVLVCEYNKLTALDVSKNTALRRLYVQNNYFTSEKNIIGLNKSSLYDFEFDPQRTNNAVLSSNRTIPIPINSPAETALAPQMSAQSSVFSAGPNPAVSLRATPIQFFRTGAVIKSATLHVYDASGNIVRKIFLSDNAVVGSSVKRSVGSWDLRDGKGRLVSAGTYLVKGVIKASGGKRESVSLVVGVK